jgi:NAD(P)-dependent dehydrogenase (short-subunit alcohol dehydrogenase family)/phosphopantetheinyl transferase/3-hydroxymyristoyl/3-hydroxydecanoyl-(acyl carrier protein) dehydratase
LNSKELGSIILNELRSLDAVNEIYYDRNERYSLTLSKEAFSFTAHSGAPKTLVASGGARGVTAEVVKSFVKHGTRNVFLLGRTNPGTELVDIAQRKQDIKDRMTASGIQFTPAMVEKELDQVRKANDGFINMQEMMKLGATVQFVQCDVAQNPSVQSAFQAIEQQTDRIDLVIHGAGVEESKLLEDKDLAGFRRVYFPKVQGALNIINQISSHTFFLSMGSIAGRFGNEGQVDYAAANDAVAHLCQQRTNSLHISWSAWADVGMAVRGGMKHVLTERGIDLLPVDFCAKQTVALVEHRALGEVVITGALGNLRLPTSQPMLREIRITSKGLAGYTTLHPNTHKWLSDHAIGDTPVLPGVIGLELMAQTFQSVHHNQQIGGISNVQFHRPVKFHRDQPVDIEILVDILGTTAQCTLLSTRTLAGGRIQRTTHFEATMHISPAFQHKLLREEPLQDVTLSNEDVYKVFFHGPTFQVMDTGRSLSPKELLMDCMIDHQSTGPNNQTSPLTIESAFQTAGWLHYHNTKETVLPSAIQSIRIYQKATDWEGLIVRAQPVVNQPYTYNIDVFQNHSIVMSLRGATFIATTIPPKGTKNFWTPEPDVYVASSQEDLQSIPQPDIDKLRSRGTLKRIQDRLAGRDAIYGVLKNLNIQDQVIQTDLGQPLLTEHSEMGISITHRNGVGWAALHTNGLVGIDVEGIELRTSQFMQDWFTQHERMLVGTCATKQTIIWSTKEALSKMLGVGFTVHPKEFEVLEIHATTCIVSFGPNAQNHWSAIHNQSPLRCYWTQMDNEILSLVTVRTLKAKSIC